MSGAFCDGYKIGFCVFSIEDALHFLGFRFEWCIVLQQRKYIVCCGIYFAPRDGSMVPVNGYFSAMDVNAKGDD